MSTDDRMETITAETDSPTVCITHGRFIPCRNEDWHHFTDNPYWVKSVRDFQGSDDPNLTWEPATLTITDPALIRAADDPDERTTPAPVGAAVALDLDASHVRTDPACTFHDGATPKASRGKSCPACMRLDLDAMGEHVAREVFTADGIPFVRCSCSTAKSPTSHRWLSEHVPNGGVAELQAVVKRQAEGAKA